MKGIRKKINTGFLVLIVLLMFSGMVSLFELERLTNRTKALLESSYYNLELSTRMLDAVEQQNSSLLQMILFEQTQYDQSYIVAGRDFDTALQEAADIEEIHTALDSIVTARDRYRELIPRYFDEQYDTDVEWFLSMYKTVYNSLTTAIKEYMTASQYSLVSRATQLENNAYRAIMPGVITLVVAIIIVLVFMFLIDFYYTRPVVKIQKGLEGYLRQNIPYRVKTEGSDEITALGDSIEGLVSACAKNRTNNKQ